MKLGQTFSSHKTGNGRLAPTARKLFATSLVAAGTLLIAPFPGSADQPSNAPSAQPLFPKQIVLDGTTYSDKDLISAFAEIAFDSYIRPNNILYALPPEPPHERCTEEIVRQGKLCGTPPEYKESYPWLYEYLYRDEGTPRYYAINKWTGPIRISIGYPNDLIPALPANGQSASSESDIQAKPHYSPTCERLQNLSHNSTLCLSDGWDLTEMNLDPGFESSKNYPASERSANYTRARKVVEEEINSALPTLRELTKLPVSYIPHNSETQESIGNVRIILESGYSYPVKNSVIPAGMGTAYDGAPGSLPFGDDDYVTHWYSSISFRDQIESIMTTAVHFIPYAGVTLDGGYAGKNADDQLNHQQVDGYLLPIVAAKCDSRDGLRFEEGECLGIELLREAKCERSIPAARCLTSSGTTKKQFARAIAARSPEPCQATSTDFGDCSGEGACSGQKTWSSQFWF